MPTKFTAREATKNALHARKNAASQGNPSMAKQLNARADMWSAEASHRQTRAPKKKVAPKSYMILKQRDR